MMYCGDPTNNRYYPVLYAVRYIQSYFLKLQLKSRSYLQASRSTIHSLSLLAHTN